MPHPHKTKSPLRFSWRSPALAFFLLSGFSSASAQSEKLEHVVLQLKWTHQFQFAGYYMASHLDYYREAGLDVEIRPGSATLDVTEEVLSGKADFGVGTSSLLIDYAEGKPVVVLGVIYQHSPLVLIMRTQTATDTIQNLREGPVMIEAHSADLLAMLRRNGLSGDDLEIIERPANALELFEGRKDISSLSAYLTDEPYTLALNGIGHTTFTPRSYGVDFYGDNFFTTRTMVNERRDLVKKFRTATLNGWKEALRDPAKVIELIQKEYPNDNSREKLLYEARITRDLMTDLVEPGYMSTARWQHIADTCLETGMINKTPDLENFIFEDDPLTLPPWFWPGVLGSGVLFLLLTAVILKFKSLNRNLHQEVARRRETEQNLKTSNRELKIAKEVSEEANLQKTWFISNVSHDLRAPISSIISLANILDHHSKSVDLPGKFKRFIKQLNSGSEFLMLMLNNILDFSASESGCSTTRPGTISFDQCSAEIINLAQPLADEREIKIEVRKDSDRDSLVIDRTRLSQIILNLLHNAIKFSPRGGTVLVRLSLNAGQLLIEIHDQGPGISLEDQENIFKMFTRADHAPNRHSGTGLGLAIVQRNTEFLNGSIRIEQAQPSGSIFKVLITLPPGKPPANHENAHH
ncbi:ABC transporter substrate-binding protein [Verrucomicrobiaceae bacterium 227]